MTFRVAKAEVRRKFAGIHTGMIAAFADKRFRSKYEDKFTLRATHGTPEDIVEWMKVGIILLLFCSFLFILKKTWGGRAPGTQRLVDRVTLSFNAITLVDM